MTDFGDILLDWEKQKKSGAPEKKSVLPQDGQAWRYKKTEAAKKKNTSEAAPVVSSLPESASKNSMSERPVRNPMSVWLQRYGVEDKDKQLELAREKEAISNTGALKQMPCEASIDLHGLTREEAEIRLHSFITECVRRGMKKVLIIHGKGNHSDEGPVLSHAVRVFIESDKRLGKFGFADKNLGGKGATWVLIR